MAFPLAGTLSNLRFVKILGSGAYGRVDLVEDESGCQFALKIIDTTAHVTKYKIERDLVDKKDFSHPHIVRGLRWWADGQYIYLLFEYAPGGQLFDEIDVLRGRVDQKVEAIRQLVEALIYCHANGLAHGDVKLENVVIQSWHPFHVKLCDFGLAFWGTYEDTTMRGSPEQISPEMTRAETPRPNISLEIDLWSLGVLTYELMYDCTPFGSYQKDPTWPRNIQAANYSFPRRAAKSTDPAIVHCRDFIRRLLVVDPAERMTLQECLNHPFLRAPRTDCKAEHDVEPGG